MVIFSQTLTTNFSIICSLVFRCLMDSGGGTPPGPPPGPCHSTSAPSRPLPRVQTWTAAVSIQSGGKAQFMGLTASWKRPEILISIHKKILPSLLPEDFINRLSWLATHVALMIMISWWDVWLTHFLMCVAYISSVCTLAFRVFCVCVYVGGEGGLLFTAVLWAESSWTVWVWTHHFFFFCYFSPVPPENMQTVLCVSFQFRTFWFFMKAGIHSFKIAITAALLNWVRRVGCLIQS